MKTTLRLRMTGLFILTLVALAAFWWLQRPTLPPLATATVRQSDIESILTATAKIDAIERVNVGAQVSGQVKLLTIRTGDRVRKGQLIAEIDDLPQRSDLRYAEAALSSVMAERDAKQAVIKRSQASFERQRRLLAEQAGSRQEYEAAAETLATARAELKMLNARIVQAQIEVDKKQLELSYTRILAPMDGTIIAIITRQGQTLNASQSAPVIAKLAQLDTMTLRVQLSEADIDQVSVGQQAWFTIFSDPEKRYQATLRHIELVPESVMKDEGLSNSDSSAANAAVYYNALMDVPNPDHQLRIAMTAQVSLVKGTAKNALLIPLQALSNLEGNRAQVTVVDPQGVQSPRQVTLGINNGVEAQVTDGLKLGETVLTGGEAPAAGGDAWMM